MKPLRPVTAPAEDVGYPSVKEALSRRDFIKSALASATALGGLFSLPSAVLNAARKRAPKKTFRVTVTLKKPYKFWSCRYQVNKVVLETPFRRLATFMAKKSEAGGIDAALVKVLSAHKCKDIKDAKRLKKLHARLGDAVRARYLKRTRRKIAAPEARMVIKRMPPPPQVLGTPPVPRRP